MGTRLRLVDPEMRDRITEARAQLVLNFPFFGTLSLRLDVIEDGECPTMWTDGVNLGYNPEFVEGLSDDELQGCVGHEVLHCALLHCVRREGREEKKWNHACDYAINPVLLEAGMVLPEGALIHGSYTGKPSEEIYDLLPDSPKGGGGWGGKGKRETAQVSIPGEVRDGPDVDQKAELEQEWKTAVAQAAQVAKAQGNLPASLFRLVEGALQPKTDWKAMLRQYVQSCTDRDDYTWKQPNHRYLAQGVYLPSLHGESVPAIVVAIDTSGSIPDTMFSQFVAELQQIVLECKPETTYTVYCDAAVQGMDEWPRGEFDAKQASTRRGMGGTSFIPVFDWIADEGIIPACLIYLTDTYGTYPTEPPAYPVIWAKTTDGEVPWGMEVKIKL